MGRYQSIVLGPYLYIRSPISGGNVPEYSTGLNTCIGCPISGWSMGASCKFNYGGEMTWNKELVAERPITKPLDNLQSHSNKEMG